MMLLSFRPLLILGLAIGMAYAAGAFAADTVAGAAPSAAQAPKSVVTRQLVTAPYDVEKPAGQRPLFRLFGLPVVVSAPVAAPYSPLAYRELAGQPESGRDAVMEQSVPGARP